MLLEQSKSRVGAAFLHDAKQDVEDQKRCDHERFDVGLRRDLNDDCDFEHPRYRLP
jgi:hypothetical protein